MFLLNCETNVVIMHWPTILCTFRSWKPRLNIDYRLFGVADFLSRTFLYGSGSRIDLILKVKWRKFIYKNIIQHFFNFIFFCIKSQHKNCKVFLDIQIFMTQGDLNIMLCPELETKTEYWLSAVRRCRLSEPYSFVRFRPKNRPNMKG